VTSLRPAAFLDRDGTIVEDVQFLHRVDDVRLLPGAARAIAALNAAGVPVILVSNQSGIGRGIFGHDDFVRVQQRMMDLLAADGARLDAVYICPHAPTLEPPCDCRKPKVALFEQAAREHALDLARSWYFGDRWRDVEPGRALGGTGLLIPAPLTPPEDLRRSQETNTVRASLEEATREMLGALTGVERGR
jgi:histidinol-phosphate phosphatase family protein